MNYILQPWPWYLSGFLIAIVMFALIYFGKTFGMSSNLRTFCAIGGAGKKLDFFNINWREYKWNLMVVVGAVIGGFIAHFFFSTETPINLSTETTERLTHMGFSEIGNNLLPPEIYGWQSIISLKGILILAVGGILIGFGTRYAGGCTSGHAITGLSSLQLPSLIAVVGFFIGGLLMTHYILPLIFNI